MPLSQRKVWVACVVFAIGSVAFAASSPNSSQLLVSAPGIVTSIGATTRSLAFVSSSVGMPTMTVNVQIQAPPEEKPIDWFARWVAFAGLIVGGVNFWFAYWKLGRDRRLSIEDEFWFRKIITPAAIEPMLKTFVELFAEVPDHGASIEKQAAYARKVTSEFAKLYPAIQTLSLFSVSLPGIVTEKLSECEDALSEYAASLSIDENSNSISVKQLQIDAWLKMNSILKMIKAEHLKAK